MTSKYIVIGLLMAVFAFPTNDSFVFAKSCKAQMVFIEAGKKEEIRSLCEDDILPSKALARGFTIHTRVQPTSRVVHLVEYCEKGDWSVATNPEGGCVKQPTNQYSKHITWNSLINDLRIFSCELVLMEKMPFVTERARAGGIKCCDGLDDEAERLVSESEGKETRPQICKFRW